MHSNGVVLTGKVHPFDDQENMDNTSGCISKRLKTPKRINHKGETMLHVLAIKVNIKIIIHIYHSSCISYFFTLKFLLQIPKL